MADPRDDRDRQIEQMLRRTASRPSPSSACVEGEQLAAWVAKSLPPLEAGRVEAHLADCPDCQAMLAAFIESEPVASALPSRLSWRLRWFVPIAAASAAVLVWAVVLPEPGQVPTAESTMARAEPGSGDMVAASPRSAAPPVEASGDAAASPPRDRDNAPSAGPVEADGDFARAQQVGPQEAMRETASSEGLAEAKTTSPEPIAGRAEGQRAAPSEAPAARALAPAAVAPAAPPPSAPAAVAEERFQSAARQAGNATMMDSVTATMTPPVHARVDGTTPTVFAAPDDPAGRRLVRWRIGTDGRVERSSDGGQRWDPADITGPAFMTAGSAPAPDVCWLVGRDGMVMRSTDGTSFERRLFPETVALVGVEATDAERAVATSADGRAFLTSDGGASWRLSP